MRSSLSTMAPAPRPLKVSIVGGGLGGLTAAVALRRNGHHIRIFESSQVKAEIGAGIALQVNALRVLRTLGFSRENLQGIDFDGGIVFDAQTGVGTPRPWQVPRNGDPELHDVMCLRSDAHDELKRLATGEGDGPPVQLHLASKVVACEPDAGKVTLDSGETILSDLVIGADGIHSVVRTSILGHPEKAPPSGWICFRCLFDAPDLSKLSGFEWVTEGLNGARAVVWKGDDSLRVFFLYPVRDGTIINFVGFFDDPDQGKPGWVPTATREDILEKFQDFDPKFLRLFDLPVTGPILKWQLKALPHLPTWIRGHAALLGDAAHATLPMLGQGAAMAIEEAGVLGVLLPLGTTKEEVPVRLAAYQALRKERGEFVNTEAVSEAGDPAKRGLYLRSREIQDLMFEHDAIQLAQEYFTAHFSG
ncbi:FAD/NAD(P)-binding domain-containing protein [Mycena galericulata]|nr:FAD/NAD(P)-binding domain-containing protein [Mycena galericulata]